ncbi:hypothetical protein CKAH01_00144 [Colletotrichum kahawae]|uniref:Uncharacterized protein n=1 Tax=Colletotrichum kahawae TaxID=34407 RepID=A0AAD9YUL1_COLKA|nr:hypothetical protein CKAH01_00144 [Colletotrichum kahawae]
MATPEIMQPRLCCSTCVRPLLLLQDTVAFRLPSGHLLS